MEKKRAKIKLAPVIMIAVVVIAVIGVTYINWLNKTVTNNIIQNISELAEHDKDSIKNYVDSIWTDLEYIQGKIESYNCDTIADLETWLNVECANSAFSHVCMVSEDKEVYTDGFVTYNPYSDGQNAGIDFLKYFENGDDRVVVRLDDKVSGIGITNESILYGISIDNLTVDGKRIAALFGISDIENIQSRLSINSFVKNGTSRGNSSVIDMDGNYIVNVERTVYLNGTKENFFDKIDQSRKSGLTSIEILEKMRADESFSFYHTDEDGVERIVFCMPFDEEEIPWYFVSSVEITVFSEQNRSFLAMSMTMLAAMLIVIIAVMLIAAISKDKVIKANAEAKARGTFLANMSHEIRTPLNGIIGLIYLIDKDMDLDADKHEIKQKLSKTKETAQYLLSLINNILDYSKLQAGRVELNNDVISPELVLDAVWSMQKNNIDNRGINFNVEKDIKAPMIIGDDTVLKQVLMNILSNAAKFTPKGGSITLSVSQTITDKSHVSTTFKCADTGCGMSPEFLEHIWDSFTQERESTDESIKGTGLGMAISKLLVDAMGGEIKVESRLGEGSTFYVVLYSEFINEPCKYAPSIEPVLEKGLKILVVEDNELNAEILVEILEDEGYKTTLAQNGQIAVDIFEKSDSGEYDLILMDMQMPVMDGCTATAKIRSLDRDDAKTVPIFACTANAFNDDRERAYESGMNDFLSKPVDVYELLKKLGSVKKSDISLK